MPKALPDRLVTALARDPRTANVHLRFIGQVDLMRTTFSGFRLALGLAVMVVFIIMASQFKSLRLPLVMLFTIPVSLFGIVLALVAAGQGFSITALMGVLTAWHVHRPASGSWRQRSGIVGERLTLGTLSGGALASSVASFGVRP